MSISSGFFNSSNGDRKYDASQISSVFDGLITDGIFATIGTAFAVKAAGGLVVNVGIGKAWFNHTWTVNDAVLPLTAPDAEVLYNRIDAVVLEVNASDAVRENTVKFVMGTPASSPANPTLTNSGYVHQYPLCYIYRGKGTTEITQENITSTIGTTSTPFVTAMLQTVSLDELLGQWEAELDTYMAARSSDVDTWCANKQQEIVDWIKELSESKLAITAGTTDMTAGVDELTTGTLYLVYE